MHLAFGFPHNHSGTLLHVLALCLHVVACGAGDQLSVLLGLPGLRSLSLLDSGISQESLAHVGRCTKLTRLELQVGCL
jgi:hypothetical protein